MPTKQEIPLLYFFLFVAGICLAPEGASIVTKIQCAIAAVASAKLLNQLLKWLDEWYLFLGGVILSLLIVYYIANPFFIYYAMIAGAYVAFIFYGGYRMATDKPEHSYDRNPTFAEAFRNFSHEMKKRYK